MLQMQRRANAVRQEQRRAIMKDQSFYLGDGAYLTCDDYQLWLARDDHRNRVIALEYEVFFNLIERGAALFASLGFPKASIKRRLQELVDRC